MKISGSPFQGPTTNPVIRPEYPGPRPYNKNSQILGFGFSFSMSALILNYLNIYQNLPRENLFCVSGMAVTANGSNDGIVGINIKIRHY